MLKKNDWMFKIMVWVFVTILKHTKEKNAPLWTVMYVTIMRSSVITIDNMLMFDTSIVMDIRF